VHFSVSVNEPESPAFTRTVTSAFSLAHYSTGTSSCSRFPTIIAPQPSTILFLLLFLSISISSPIMASIVRNVVNWSTHHSSHSSGAATAHAPSRTAQTQAQVSGRVQRGSPSAGSDMCEVCGKNPKFVERGYKHPYCSRTCATKTTSPLGTTPTKSSTHPTPNSNPANCTFNGCDFEAQYHGYCGPEHAMEAVRMGLAEACDVCRDQPWVYSRSTPAAAPSGIRIVAGSKGSNNNGGKMVKLCPGCERVARGGVQIKELGNRDGKFSQVRKQFIREWNVQNESLPTVDKVYQVILPRDEINRYQSYRKTLKNPRELRTYHASLVVCDLGTKGPFLCERKGCGVCSVIRSSFREFAFEEEYNQGRFGPGIYTYINPKLADKYATTVTTSPYRVVVACDILLDAQQEISTDESVFIETAGAVNAAYVIMYSM
jgi:hypothetical protein